MAERGGRTDAFRAERRVFAGTGLFLVPWTILYWATADERAGGVLLAVCAVSLLVLAGYLTVRSRGVEPRPEDRRDEPAPPSVARHAPEISIWPLVIGVAAMILGYGMAFTVWVAMPGLLLFALGIIGYARETG